MVLSTKKFQLAPPGTVLRNRPAPGNLTTITANCSEAFNILYRTLDSNNKPTWAVTTLFVPELPSLKAGIVVKLGRSLLCWSIPYDSDSVDASKSFLLYQPSQTAYLQAVIDGVSQGWHINVPDYEGPLAAFTAGAQSSYAMIDSMRAVKNAATIEPSIKLSQDVVTTMWGYSGGALACEWAAELQPSYASELHFGGAAIGGLTPSIPVVTDQVAGTEFAGLIPAALLGIAVESLSARQALVSGLKTSGPFNASGFLQARIGVLDEPVMADVIQHDGTIGLHDVPDLPLFIYEAVANKVSLKSETDVLVSRFVRNQLYYKFSTKTLNNKHPVRMRITSTACLYVTIRIPNIRSKSNYLVDPSNYLSSDGITKAIKAIKPRSSSSASYSLLNILNDNTTQTSCSRYSTSDISFTNSECQYIGPDDVGGGRNIVLPGISNYDFRELCTQAGATGSDSSCSDKITSKGATKVLKPN
ncbi:LIP-domain-containing protein [Colletotrichum eremochloae]|nr:LIP-domain-containing protein [Colletotrichum eremochloae]